MSLEDAFKLQEALALVIKRVTTVTTEVALRGAKVTKYQAGETVCHLTYKHDGRDYPSTLTIAVTVGGQ
jgi:hypothetical protein